jgi:hypothetical protein
MNDMNRHCLTCSKDIETEDDFVQCINKSHLVLCTCGECRELNDLANRVVDDLIQEMNQKSEIPQAFLEAFEGE